MFIALQDPQSRSRNNNCGDPVIDDISITILRQIYSRSTDRTMLFKAMPRKERTYLLGRITIVSARSER